jgi:uncharacterized membrane protein YhdT
MDEPALPEIAFIYELMYLGMFHYCSAFAIALSIAFLTALLSCAYTSHSMRQYTGYPLYYIGWPDMLLLIFVLNLKDTKPQLIKSHRVSATFAWNKILLCLRIDGQLEENTLLGRAM